MSGVLDIVKSVYGVAKAIYDQVERAQANQAQCRTLAGRVKVIESTLVGLDAVQRGQLLQSALQELKGLLDEILVWIQQHGNQHWLKRVWKAKEQQAKFPKFAERLQQAMQPLELGVSAQALINHEQDLKDQQADQAYLKDHLQAIEAAQAQELKALQHLDEKQVEHQAILSHQMAAYHRELLAALAVLQPASPSKTLPEAKVAKPLLSKHLAIPYFELQFDFSQPLGKSALGESYRGVWQSQPVALKQLAANLNLKEQKLFGRELKILSRLQNEHVLQFYGACLEAGHACIVTEYLSGGTLVARLRQGGLSVQSQQALALDVARGLHYLHVKGLVHADLRTANILLTAAGRAKLSEFGLAQSQSATLASLHETSPALPSCAPEILQRHPVYSAASDVYSYGTVLWELLTGRVPYADQGNGLREALLAGRRESLDGIPAFYAQLITACWDPEPSKRPALPILIKQLETYQPPLSADHLRDQGVEAERKGDLPKARDYYQQALAAGSVKAMTSLGMFAWKGQGGEAQDAKRAYSLFKRGAEGGHDRAMYNLAYLLETGEQGVPQDLKAALRWYHALAQGPDHNEGLRHKACERIEKIRSRYGLVWSPPAPDVPSTIKTLVAPSFP